MALRPILMTKKAVQFNNILESRNIDDEFSYSDSDFGEDYQPPKVTKTQSGRIVKAKRFFDDEPEVKRRRKSSEEGMKNASENVEQSLRLKPVNTVNFVTGKPSPPVNSSTLSKEVFNKKLVVLVEKIPESVYKSYVASGNICDLDSSSNQKSINAYDSSNSQTKLLNHGSKVISKSFPVVTGSELSRNLNQNNSTVTTVSCDPQSSITSNNSQRLNIGTTSKKLVRKARTKKTNTSSQSDETCNKNLNTVTSIRTPRFPAKRISFLNNPSLLSFPNQTNTKSYFNTAPQVKKQFLYAGPKQDINKIKSIIEELKTMPTPNVQTSENSLVTRSNSSRLSQNICNKNTPNVGNLNGTTPDTDSFRGTGYELSGHESKNGILEKTVLKDVILIKVTPELMQKMQRETLSTSERHANLESFYTAKVSPEFSKDLNEVSHITETSGIMPTVYRKNIVSPKGEHGNLKLFWALKPANISSVSSSLSKKSSKVSQLTDKDRATKLIQNVHKKPRVSRQKRHRNLNSCSTTNTAYVSPVFCSLNKNINEVSQITDKNQTPELMQKVKKKTLKFLQREHGNLKSLSAVRPANISSVSSSMSKKLSSVSHITEKNRNKKLMQKEYKKVLVSPQRENRNFKSVSLIRPSNISPVSQQRKHENVEPSSTVMSANISEISYSLNKDLTEVSQLVEKNERLLQKIKREISEFLQKGNGNFEPSSAVMFPTISTVSSSINNDLTTENYGLVQKVKSDTPVSLQRGHRNLGPSSAVMPANILPVSSSLNKDLTEVSQSTEKNKMLKLLKNIKREIPVSLQKEHENLEPFQEEEPANISPVSCSLNKVLTEVSHITAKNRITDVPKSPEVVLLYDSNSFDKPLKCVKSETLTSYPVTSNYTFSKTPKIPEQKTEFSNSIDKKCTQTIPSQSEHFSFSREEKLIERYKAKIEEKERKKKEKYELKKQMRYLEKIRCRNNSNLTKFLNSSHLSVYKKPILVFSETHNKSSLLERNLEEDAELPVESKKKSITTEIVPNLKNEESTSVVRDKNLAITPARSQKYPCKTTKGSRSSAKSDASHKNSCNKY